MYDYFWTILFLLGISVILVCTVFIRTFVLGSISSGMYRYVLIFLISFCIMSLINWIKIGDKGESDSILLLFYFLFSVIFCLCLMSISKPLLGIDLYSSYKELQSHIHSLLSNLGITLPLALPKDILAAVLALLMGCLPPLFMSCGFRYAQLYLRSKYFLLLPFNQIHPFHPFFPSPSCAHTHELPSSFL